MVQDLLYNLCESLVENIGGVAGVGKKTPPTPITYLTQWKIVGNSEVHTDPYLTSWKVSGNSVVDNNTIMSCGDLGQDGKYHVKISNGVDVFDISLDEPLRKVNDVADNIELVNGVVTLTRNIASILIGQCTVNAGGTTQGTYRFFIDSNKKSAKGTSNNDTVGNVLCSQYNAVTTNDVYNAREDGVSVAASGNISIYDTLYATSDAATYKAAHADTEIIYEVATPTTEVIQVSPFPVSATDTYTSANVTPYSAFEYKKNVEIWSCGEYNSTDGKYHILVQPLGGSIADIALDEPLRKVNDVADTIEFPSETEGKALVTRNLSTIGINDTIMGQLNSASQARWLLKNKNAKVSQDFALANMLSNKYSTIPANRTWQNMLTGVAINNSGIICLFDFDYTELTDKAALIAANVDTIILYELFTPTTELVDAPQIAEADSYSMVISQGAKAIEWSSFTTE